MKVQKRNGTEVDFDSMKIFWAISKASQGRMTIKEIEDAMNVASFHCHTHNFITVEEIQDIVESTLMQKGFYDVARDYVRYRYDREKLRTGNSTDSKILTLVDNHNEEAKQENSNKDPSIVSVQRDYIAGYVSRDITNRLLLPKEIVEAHEAGIIHFHDSDYFVTRSHNCFTGDTRFVTSDGIRTFNSYHDGDIVTVLDKDGHMRQATVKCYGYRDDFQKVTLKNGRMEHTVVCTKDHRWILENYTNAPDTVTTQLKVGDVLQKLVDSTKWEIHSATDAQAFCIGFVVGDGCDHVTKTKSWSTQVRLCGEKTKWAEIFRMAGYSIQQIKNSTDCIAIRNIAMKQNFLNGKAWRYMTPYQKKLAFTGLYAADGGKKANTLSTSDSRICQFIEETADIAGYHISSYKDYIRDTNYKENAYLRLYHFVIKNLDNLKWKVVSINPVKRKMLAWCVEEPSTHSFTLEKGIVTGNCDLINLQDMLQNGTVISETMIEKPHSFSTACNIAMQIVAQVASCQYGGQSLSLAHLAPFVDISRQNIRKEVEEELAVAGATHSQAVTERIVASRLAKEIKKGIQTIQYQVMTLMTTNGQAPFLTVFMALCEAKNKQEKHDLALIIEEVLKQRIQGVKNEAGAWITPAFPKLIYTLDQDNIYEDSPYYYLTRLSAECTAKRLVPDYISAKVMRQLKGDVYPAMGCRSFLTPDRFTETGIGNIGNAGNYAENKHKYYGRFNQGVVTINLPDVACSAGGDKAKFWEIFDSRLQLCHKALRCRHERLLGTTSDAAPILWQHGALARLQVGEKIDRLLYNGYSTISLGYAGLYECVMRMTGHSHTDKESGAYDFATEIMQHMNDKCNAWKQAENIDYSLYGTPLESTTYKFAKALKKRWGVIPEVSDHDYITNSYHVCVREKITAFEKLKLESTFQRLSPGGAISYVEVPNMQNNIPAVLAVMRFIYDNIMYAELNTKSDFCQVCGYDGQIQIVEVDDKLEWECPKCGNRDQHKLNVARRTCG